MKLISFDFNKTDFLKTLFHSKNYLFSRVVQIILNFVSIAVFTRLMSKNDYGVFAVFMSYLGLFTILYSANLTSAIQRFSYEKHSQNDFKHFMSTFFVIISILFVIITPILLLNQKILYSWMNLPEPLLILMVLSTQLIIINQAYLQYLIPRKKSSEFMIINIVKQFFFFLFSLIFVFLLVNNLFLGRIYGSLLIDFILGIYFLWKFKFIFRSKPKLSYAKYMFSYSLPLLVSSLASIILAHFDKIMINSMVDSASAGVYSIGYNVGAMLIPVVASVQNALSPNFFKMQDKQNFNRLHNLMKKSFSIVLIAALFLLYFSKEIILFFVDSVFFDSISIIPIIVFACVFYALTYFYGSYLLYYKKMIVGSIIVFISGTVNVLLNLIFIPQFGYTAAAYTTLFSYVLMFFLTWSYLKIKKIIICPLHKLLFSAIKIFSLFFIWKLIIFFIPIDSIIITIILKLLLFIIGVYLLFYKEINTIVKEFIINKKLVK